MLSVFDAFFVTFYIMPSASNMTDSEKIALQILLDARAFGEDVTSVAHITDPSEIASYKMLIDSVMEAQSTTNGK